MDKNLTKAMQEHGREKAMPMLRSMYPSKSRTEMAAEFADSFRDGVEWARKGEIKNEEGEEE